jgi:hypothetical protein
VLVVIFLALTQENPSEAPAMGLWKSPLYPLGEVLFLHLNQVFTGQGWLIFSGLDALLVCLLAAALIRARGAATPVRPFVRICLGGIAWMWVSGILWGGADSANSLWQVQRAAALPLWTLLFERSLRTRADRLALGKLVLTTACLKAALAICLRATVVRGVTDSPYATIHADSMLFASAFCLVVVLLFLGFDRRYALALPLLLCGMIANHRRVVWLELAAGLAVVYALSPRTPAKRAAKRMVLRMVPIALLYCAAGWGSGSGIFAPVRILRSVVDSKSDGSTEWRDWENYNLCYTLRQNPLLGTGYGHGYEEAVKLPDVSEVYPLERYVPHNSILGLWAYGGLVGFAALWSMLVVAVFLAARAARHATLPVDRAAAIAVVAAILIYMVHCYGDMALGTWTSVCIVGPALAFAGHLALSTGAWPSTPPLRSPAATPRLQAGAEVS